MAVLKTQCPECDAKLRLSVDGPGDHDVECPKCGHEFTAALDEDDAPAKTDGAKKSAKSDTAERAAKGKAKGDKAGKKVKAAKSRDDDDEDDDDEDEKPKKKKKGAAADGGKTKLIVAGVAVAVLVLGAIGGIVYAVRDKPAKNTDTQAAVTPVVNPVVPGPTPPVGQTPNPGVVPAPGTIPGNGPKPPPVDPKKEPPEGKFPPLPPPPKIKISSGSLVTSEKPVTRISPLVPLAPDEDPFVRAKDFKPDGPLPTLPKLPDAKLRPLLSLDAGGHTALIGKVFFSPKGNRIITTGADKAVRFWDTATNETVRTVRFPAGPGKEGSLVAAAMARNGKKLAVSGYPVGTVATGKVPIYLLSPETGDLIKRLDMGTAAVTALHFSNDGNRLAVGCENGFIQLLDVTPGKEREIGKVRPSDATILEVRYNPSPKVNVFATLGDDRWVQLWDMSKNTLIRDFPIRGVGPTTLAWSNDGQTLAVGTSSGRIVLCTLDGKIIDPPLPAILKDAKPVPIIELQFMAGDRDIAVVGGNSFAGIIDSNTGAVRVPFTHHSNNVASVDVSADGSRIVTSGGNQQETFVWDADKGTVLNRFAGAGSGVWAIGWAKDGKSLAWGNSNARPEKDAELPLQHTFRLDDFGVGNPPDPSKYTQVLTEDGHVKVTTKSPLFLVQTTGREPEVMILTSGDKLDKIYSATCLPKGNAVVVAGANSLALFNPATAREIHKFVGHTGNVLCVTPSPDGRYFATGSSDQTIRIWQRDQNEPLLSIFVAGRDWIAWTPQGYYACSGQGERLMAWQVTAANSKVPQAHPAERFRASMYQPALLKYIIPAGDLPRAMAMAQKFDKALALTNNVADVLPPEVVLDGFGEGELKVEKDTLTVKAKATSAKHPITAMRLLVNGRPFQGSAGVKRFETPQKEAEATWEVPLPPGTHTVAVIADSPVSKGMSKVGIAVRPGVIPKPNLYVLAVAVGDYQFINKLPNAASDAPLLANALQQHSKSVFNKIEVKVLTDKMASKKGILEGMDWLKSKMTPQDVGIVSFSGHGTRDLFGNFYLCPWDMRSDDEDCATALSGNEFKKRLENMPGRLVAILDACHSGVVTDKEKPPQTDSLVRDLTAEDSGVIVMCASGGREYAIEDNRTKAGYYTFGLAEGLAGHADIDGDGYIYIHELDIYASARVKQLSEGKQNPTLGRPSSVRPFPIAKVEKPIAP